LPLPLRWRWKLDRLREKVDWFFGGKKAEGRPRLCPSCGTLVGASASRCHQCGASMTFSLAAASKSLGRLMPTTSPVTYAILTLSCLFYAVTLMLTVRENGFQAPTGGGFGALFQLGGIDGRVLVRFGSSLPLPYNLLQPWRFVMAIFLHASLLHIGFNMWVLMDVGPLVEEVYGSARYLFIYVATGICGYIVSSAFGHHSSVGGSGALLGLIGVLLALTRGRQNASLQMLRGSLIRWLIYIAIMGFLGWGMIDNFAHIGGALSGYLIGSILPSREPVDLHDRRVANAMGWGAGLAVAVSFALMALTYFHPLWIL
jgi:membrane associated rhomboid family serine protease